MKPIDRLLALAVLLLIGTSAAHAQPFLSAVVSYGANASGGSLTEPSEFDNIAGSGNFAITINGQPRGTTFALSLGPNDFAYSGVDSNYNALSLYFAPTAAAFNRPFASTPDLVGYTLGAGPLTPVAGAQVQTNGVLSGTVPWTGTSLYSDGAFNVAFTQFISSGGNGTFQLTVTPIPEPTLAACLALPFLIVRRRRRDRRSEQKN